MCVRVSVHVCVCVERGSVVCVREKCMCVCERARVCESIFMCVCERGV